MRMRSAFHFARKYARAVVIPRTSTAIGSLLRHDVSTSVTSVSIRHSSSSSNSRWKMRQGKDMFARDAKVQGLKSRAAFKLLELDSKYRLFRKGQVVVDLGYAPGSWSQVAAERTKPFGSVIGIDLIPAQPPSGVSTIQGNFLLPEVRVMVKEFILDTHRRPLLEKQRGREFDKEREKLASEASRDGGSDREADGGMVKDRPSYIDMERASSPASTTKLEEGPGHTGGTPGLAEHAALVNVVLSDMSAPWDQTTGFGVNTLSNPHDRMMNTSGISFRDHVGSMDLCYAALQFASDTLKSGGHFVCKFYQGAEDKALEKQLRQLFARVHREKPESSRKDSKEAYFVALDRKGNIRVEDMEGGQLS